MNQCLKTQWPIRLLLLAVIWIATGCSPTVPLSKETIAGIYLAKYSHGEETLELRNDGTYSQRYVAAGEKAAVENVGRWSLLNNSETVLLTNALLFDDRRGHRQESPSPSAWSLRVDNVFGEIKLVINDDGALAFRRKPKLP